jgi:signal transduction histidine kinase
MADVESTARTALEEMRRMLGLLRPPGDADGDAEAAAGGVGVARGIADLGELAATMTAAGLPVTVCTTGEPYPVPEDVGLTVYRITQEALTNVLKHAGPAEAEVHLTYGEDLELTVADNGRGAAAGLAGPTAPGAGRGTTGMRERAAMLDGKFTAGPRAGGGYQVHATLPCEHDSGPAAAAQRESEPH